MIFLCFLFAPLLLLPSAEPARILCFFPTPSKSGTLMTQPLMVELAKRGHHVTVVSSFALGHTMDNYRDIVIPVERAAKVLTKTITSKEKSHSMLTWLPKLVKLALDSTNETMNHPDFKPILNEKFDLVVFGYFFNNFQLGLANHFKCPSVLLSTAPFFRFLEELVGHPNNPEAVRSVMIGKNDEDKSMTFFERVLNLLAFGLESLMFFYAEYRNQIYYDYNFADSTVSYSDAKKSISLVMVNQHLGEGWIRPLLPSIIEVGGLQIKSKPSPLPNDIKTWIEDSKHGIILVSFGTNFRSADMQQEKLDLLINSFKKIKQRVIWKFENETLPNLPENVLIKSWLPQDDILAHPNTKIFITHCGISSYNEALFHGIPIIAIPFVSDQPLNAKRAKDAGWAIVLPFLELTEKNLDEALIEIVKNETYSKMVQKLSFLYRDRPLSAMENAVYWIEYVMRHNGAPQLRYPGIGLSFIQQKSWDVLVFLVIIFYVTVKMTKLILRKLINICCSKKRDINLGRHEKKNN